MPQRCRPPPAACRCEPAAERCRVAAHAAKHRLPPPVAFSPWMSLGDVSRAKRLIAWPDLRVPGIAARVGVCLRDDAAAVSRRRSVTGACRTNTDRKFFMLPRYVSPGLVQPSGANG